MIVRHVRFAVLCLSLVSGVPRAMAHGTESLVVEGAVAIKAVYDDQSPMAFCDVSVFAPGESTEPFLTGASDANGHFAFVPDRMGTWSLQVDDGMGHLVSVSAVVDDNGLPQVVSLRHTDRLRGGVVGVGVILGVFGLAALLTRRTGRRNASIRVGEECVDAHL